MKKKFKVKAYADIGSHGGIFYFLGGPVAALYPELMQIYRRKLTKDLKPVTITYEVDI